MKRLLIVGPTEYPWGGDGYGGIERLCALITNGLAGRGHKVIAAVPQGSVLDNRVSQITVKADPNDPFGELVAYNATISVVSRGDVDFVIDLSHKHLIRWKHEWPGFSWIWHDPYVAVHAKFPKSNVMALSQWQADRFKKATGQDATVCDIHTVNEGYCWKDVPVSDRWVNLGRIDRDKGADLAAIMFKEWGIGLDIIGPEVNPVIGDLLRVAESQTHGLIKWHGEVSENVKLDILHQAKGLFYWPADGFLEAHAMKLVEALCCGVPCVVRDVGSYRDAFEGQGIALYKTEEDAQEDITCPFLFDAANRSRISSEALAKWGLPAVLDRMEALFGD